MAKEIERKFLVNDPTIVSGLKGKAYLQGYISKSGTTVRVRVVGEMGYLTIKGPAKGAERDEYEYQIPVKDANEMLQTFCEDQQVQKVRYLIPKGQHTFEVDVFTGENDGLVLAEVEISSEDEEIERPAWLGREVTYDGRFSNSSLAKLPFKKFSDSL